MVCCRARLADVEVDAELFDKVVLEVSSLVGKDFSWDSVTGYNLVYQEGGDVLSGGGGNCSCFGPLSEILGAD